SDGKGAGRSCFFTTGTASDDQAGRHSSAAGSDGQGPGGAASSPPAPPPTTKQGGTPPPRAPTGRGRRTTAAGCQSGRHPDSDGQGRRCVTTTAGSSSSDYQGGGGGRAAGSGSGSGRGRRGSCTALLVGHTASRNPRQGSPTRRRFGVQVGEATRHQRPLRRQGHRLLQLRRTSRQALLREPVTPKTNHSPRRRRTRVWNGRRLRLQRRALLLRRAHTSRHHDSANPPWSQASFPSHKHRRRPRSDSTRLHYGCLPRLHQFEPAVHGAALLDLHLRFPVGCQAPYQLLATPSLGQSRRCAKPYEQDLVRRPALGTSFSAIRSLRSPS
ncbi:hypothetical protein EE612_057965, partial [Oryza sativa]